MEFANALSDGSDSGDEVGEGQDAPKQVYVPGTPLKEDEELICDESAYLMYHQAQTGAPCLSFDVIKDPLGDDRGEVFPMTMYMVAGTQAERAHVNNIIVIKMSNLTKTKEKSKNEDEDDDEEESGDEGEDEEDTPELEAAMIKHDTGGVNRVRCTCIGDKQIAASWSEQGGVFVWDLSRPLQAVNDSQIMATYTRNQETPSALYKFTGHQSEGFAMDWSSTVQGNLLTGDCTKNIHFWVPQEGGTWHVDQRAFAGHTASVEDIQWSPNEANVFSSCSVDKSIRIWDTRAAPSKACMLTAADAHDRDINVISWNKREPFIVSGGDDGCIKIWDLRQFQGGQPVAVFKHHTAPITSVEWHPVDSTVFAASGSDDQLTLWDLAVERDTEAMEGDQDVGSVPPQLLFIHQGQKDIKELHWHPQCHGSIISTAHSGFNIFRTISV